MKKNKIIQFLYSVFVGILKATPIGHIKTEIENNLYSDKTTPSGELDKTRLIVWIITTILIVLKAFNIITFEQIIQILKLVTQ